jgi:hypothetical protein
MKQQTTTQIIFEKHKQMRWLDFIEWLEQSKDMLIEHNQKEIEEAHFFGKTSTEMSVDYFRKKYSNWRDGLNYTRTCINQKWYCRLYYNGNMIGNFLSFEDALEYAEKNYDRATDTIKAN